MIRSMPMLAAAAIVLALSVPADAAIRSTPTAHQKAHSERVYRGADVQENPLNFGGFHGGASSNNYSDGAGTIPVPGDTFRNTY